MCLLYLDEGRLRYARALSIRPTFPYPMPSASDDSLTAIEVALDQPACLPERRHDLATDGHIENMLSRLIHTPGSLAFR
jgi:hypothetical protein